MYIIILRCRALYLLIRSALLHYHYIFLSCSLLKLTTKIWSNLTLCLRIVLFLFYVFYVHAVRCLEGQFMVSCWWTLSFWLFNDHSFFFLLREIGPEPMSVPICLYFVCGMPPQHGLMSGVGLCPGSELVNPGPPKQSMQTEPLWHWACPHLFLNNAFIYSLVY